ncbi:MAG: plasmid pRiA4b ORF-3 family protein, partial [Bifidobacteriaceae bacterium]|nr:plasmid pRiA4b ORF-3 family protein [Bifidobacteriaceae bacterium]
MVEASPLHLLATIDEIDIPVWRLLRLDPELRLDQVRVALQIAFGWEPGLTPGFLGLRAEDPEAPRTWAPAAAVTVGAMNSTAFPGARAETWDTLGEVLAEVGDEFLFNAEPDVKQVLALARAEAPEGAAPASAPAVLVDAAGKVSPDGTEVAPSIPSRKRHLERVNRALAEAVGPPPARVAAAPAITAELAAQLVAPFQR